MYRWEDGKFSSATSGLSSACGDKPQLVGGVGAINFGKQFRQGNRVYDSDHVEMCLLAQPVGNAGGFSYLYTVAKNFNLPSIQNVTYENDVQRVGTVSENSLIGGRVIGIEGICFTLMACTHGYGMGNIYDNRKLVLDEKFKKYTKWIDFCWWYR